MATSRAAIAAALLALAATATAAPAAVAAAAPALTQAQADALVCVWDLQFGLSLRGNRFDDALKAAVDGGAPVDARAVFDAAAVRLLGITIAIVHADPAAGLFAGYAANTTLNATAAGGVPQVPQVKRYVGHAAPAAGGDALVQFELVQDDDQGQWRGAVGADGVMRVVREEGVEVWGPGGEAIVDDMGASVLVLTRTSESLKRALATIAPLLTLKNTVLEELKGGAASGAAARRGLAAACTAAAVLAAAA
jgi:hypothetical protein